MAFLSIKTSGLVILLAFVFVHDAYALASKTESHVLVSLRMIGHQLLLQSGDSISRIMPIKKVAGKYQMDIENEFGFYPDDLFEIANRVFEDANLAKGYIIEVMQCETGEVVYSFEIDAFSQINLLPCKGRELPKSCYSLFFTLWGEENLAVSSNLSEPRDKDSSSSYWLFPIIGSMVLLIGGTFLIRRKKKAEPVFNSNLIRLGQFEFNKHSGQLLKGDEHIELSGKETELLSLLEERRNETVERELILNEVWGDQGDYVGRTLDVFISKLRKKLEGDQAVKIKNIRGVGYKLVLED